MYEYIASPLFPQWVLNVITAMAAFYALRAFLAARDQANHARRQADAAEQQATIMQNQFQSNMRAFLDPTDWNAAVRTGELRTSANISCRMVNRGRTTATIQSIELMHPIRYRQSSETMVFPDGDYTFRFDVTVPGPRQDNIGQLLWDSPPTLIVLGSVRYLDGFTTRQRWFHRICAYDAVMNHHFHIPESRFNNEQELEGGQDELERFLATLPPINNDAQPNTAG
jgi:hypothetical protein